MRSERLMPRIDFGKIAFNDRDVTAQLLTEGMRYFDTPNTVKSIQLPPVALIGERDRMIPPPRGCEIADLGPNA